ncbi:hypothetical protein [Enterococcus sp.]|uniref:hypothetical protein n=1 Tax=Enterococcus sp. TaxID=35783 RepID=UPI002FCB590A
MEKNIRELLAARKILSLDKLEEIRNLYALEQTKDITEELTIEQALLLEMKRSNALKMIDAKVKHSSSLKETYIELYDAYKIKMMLFTLSTWMPYLKKCLKRNK